MNKFDYLLLIGILSMFLVGLFSILYYFNFQKNQCLANPLVYGAKQMEEKFGKEFQGSGFLIVDIGQFPSINFNSTSLKWGYLPGV